MRRELWVLLPAYNEAEAIGRLIEDFHAFTEDIRHGFELKLLLVDDGSTDETVPLANEAAATCGLELEVIEHKVNKGLGAAMLTGIDSFTEYAAGIGPELHQRIALAAMDADGTHPPKLLPKMLIAMYPGEGDPTYDVVIASRYAPMAAEYGLSFMRRVYSKMASMALAMFAQLRGVRDYTCGYRLYDAEILLSAKQKFGEHLIRETSFVCMAELLIKLGQCGAQFGEVPLHLHYELKGGPSKMNVPATIRRYLALCAKLLFRRRLD